jgi:hypothetical protein
MNNARFVRVGLRALVALFISAVVMSSCSHPATKQPGQLVVAISTDMALPEQIDTIEVVVSVNGKTLLDNPMPTGEGFGAQPIPATLTLVAGPDPTVPATIRVIGLRNNVARTLRQVVTTIPSESTAMLRMPVQWLCDGKTDCGEGATCKAGKCVLDSEDSSTLPNYEPQSVFGGSEAPKSREQVSGACFDTIACLISGTVVVPDDQCTVPMPPSGDTNVNVGLRVADDGICDATGTTCFVPLDGKSTEGWTLENGRIALPTAVCSKLREGLVGGVVVSSVCATKTASTPPCGPWSSVKLSLDAAAAVPPLDASVPAVPSLVGEVIGSDAGSKTVCCPLMADDHALYTCACDGGVARIVSIDPSSGVTAPVGSFTAKFRRAFYSTVLAGGGVYWVDRDTAGSVTKCSVNQASIGSSASRDGVAVIDGDVYDSADLLADAANLYAVADEVAGVANAADWQIMRVDPSGGSVTAFDTGSAQLFPQLTQDDKAVYVAVDTDESLGPDAGLERVSRIVRTAKAGGAPTTVAQQTLTIGNKNDIWGFTGAASDGTALVALYEGAPGADGAVDVKVEKLGAATSTDPSVLYEVQADPKTTRFRLIGAADGAVFVVRDTTQASDAGPGMSESSVIVIPADGSTPRIAASFRDDAPVGEIQKPAFTPDVFWLNRSGQVYRLKAAAFR